MTAPRPPFSNDDMWAMAWRIYSLTQGRTTVPNNNLVPPTVQNEPLDLVSQIDRIESTLADIGAYLETIGTPVVDLDALADKVAARVTAQLRTLTFTLRPPEQTP